MIHKADSESRLVGAGSKKRPLHTHYDDLRDILLSSSPSRQNRDDLKSLVMQIKTTGNLEAFDDDGYSLLHLAVMNDREDVAELLLRARANPDVEVQQKPDHEFDDDVGSSPLHFARKISMAELLLGVGERYGECFWKADPRKANAHGDTPFDIYVEYRNVDMARFVINHLEDAGKIISVSALAMKIVDLESRSTGGGDEYCRDAGGFLSLLPEIAARSTIDDAVRTMRIYARDVHKLDRKTAVYDILVEYLYQTSR
jgi:ankyrin repeat protein